jgi:peptide/nickel transport system permease protein
LKSQNLPLNVWLGGSITAFFLVCSALALVWTPFDPNYVDTMKISLGFGQGGYLLGTDVLGRDLLSGLLAGARMSVFLGCVTAAISVVLGTIFAFIAVGISPWVDEVVMRLLDVLMAVPGVIVALVIATVTGPSALSTVSVLSVFFAPVIARVVRSAALPILNEDFVRSARMYGRGTFFCLFRHVLPNTLSILVVQFSLYTANAVLAESGLSYLGVGISRPQISWGTLLKEAQETVGPTTGLMLWPATVILVFVLGLNLLGDGLRDLMDPRSLGKRS